MNFGIDLDGCLADFNSAYTKLLIDESGEDRFPPDRTPNTFPPVWFYEREFGYSKEVEEKVWTKIKSDPNFWYNLSPYYNAYDAFELLNDLDTSDHSIYFITHRGGVAPKQQTESWLINHGDFECPTVIIAGDKTPLMEPLGLDFFIDDKPETIQDICKSNTKVTNGGLYILDRPYNKHIVGDAIRTPSVAAALTDFMKGKNING